MPRQRAIKSPPQLTTLQKILGLITHAGGWKGSYPEPVFICVDCEAYEHDQRKITEIGISVFDTRRIADIPPSEAWLDHIQYAHYRLIEFALLRNDEFVQSCPDGFKFGQSTWLLHKDVPQLFQRLFSDPADLSVIADFDTPLSEQQRSVVLVGHGLKSDVQYLRSIGVEVYDGKSPVLTMLDTQQLVGSPPDKAASLKRILLCLGVEPVNLHNAGNDAAYTLQAAIQMALKEHREGVGSVAMGLAKHTGEMPETSSVVFDSPRKWGGTARQMHVNNLTDRQMKRLVANLGWEKMKGISLEERNKRTKDALAIISEVGLIPYHTLHDTVRRRRRDSAHRVTAFSSKQSYLKKVASSMDDGDSAEEYSESAQTRPPIVELLANNMPRT